MLKILTNNRLPLAPLGSMNENLFLELQSFISLHICIFNPIWIRICLMLDHKIYWPIIAKKGCSFNNSCLPPEASACKMFNQNNFVKFIKYYFCFRSRISSWVQVSSFWKQEDNIPAGVDQQELLSNIKVSAGCCTRGNWRLEVDTC